MSKNFFDRGGITVAVTVRNYVWDVRKSSLNGSGRSGIVRCPIRGCWVARFDRGKCRTENPFLMLSRTKNRILQNPERFPIDFRTIPEWPDREEPFRYQCTMDRLRLLLVVTWRLLVVTWRLLVVTWRLLVVTWRLGNTLAIGHLFLHLPVD